MDRKRKILLYQVMPATVFLILVGLGLAASLIPHDEQKAGVYDVVYIENNHSLNVFSDKHHTLVTYYCSDCHSKLIANDDYEILVVRNCAQCHDITWLLLRKKM